MLISERLKTKKLLKIMVLFMNLEKMVGNGVESS
jgi:hypothetical protein